MVRATTAAIVPLLALLAACDGAILDPDASPCEGAGCGADAPSTDVPGSRRDAPTCDPASSDADTVPARILTQTQYNNAVRDLLGDGLPRLEQSTVGGGAFDNAVAGQASSVLMPALESTARGIARAAFERGFDANCGGETDRACAERFVRDFGRRAFRRPVSAADEAALMGLYDTLRADVDPSEGQRAALEGLLSTMLQMPRFLYRIEGGVERGEGRVALDGYEMASRLSFFLWNTIPDDDLLDAAEAGTLDTEEGVRRVAEGMLDDPRARQAISHLYAQVLGLDRVPYLVKDPVLHGDFTKEIGEAMRQETLAFIETVVFDDHGTVADLFDADFTMLNEQLARFYGIEGVRGDHFRRVELDPTRRAGLLTQGSFLALYGKQSRTNPITRGVHVIRNVLCWNLPDPPADVPVLEEQVGAGESVREQLEAHRQPGCASCHRVIDPIGLTFESFDTTGRFRTEDESGNPIDTATALPDPSGEEVAFADALDLSRYLARHEDTETCAATSWFANAFARMPTSEAEQCLVARLLGQGRAGAIPIRDALAGIASSDMFRHRINPTTATPNPGEVCR